MLNQWQNFINKQESISAECEHKIKGVRKRIAYEQQMKIGFSTEQVKTLFEKPAAPGKRNISNKDDSKMRPI